MPKINNETVELWKAHADEYARNMGGFSRDNVVTGSQAWHCAHLFGWTRQAYKDPAILDAHIQTALEKVFPNAVFKDKKRY